MEHGFYSLNQKPLNSLLKETGFLECVSMRWEGTLFVPLLWGENVLNKWLLLVSKPYVESFVRSFRVGDTILLLQRCSNSKGNYISLEEIHRGGRKGAIIIPKGRNSGGWPGFGLELRRLFVIENHTVKHGGMGAKSAPVEHVAGPVKGKDLYATVISSTAVLDGAIKGKQSESSMGEIPKIVQDS